MPSWLPVAGEKSILFSVLSQKRLGLIAISSGPINWVNIRKKRPSGGPDDHDYSSDYFADFGIPDPTLRGKRLSGLKVNSTRIKSIPVIGKVIDLRWEGNDLNTGIIDELTSNDRTREALLHRSEVVIRGHGEYGCWTITTCEDRGRKLIPSEEEWDCYQRIARILLETPFGQGGANGNMFHDITPTMLDRMRHLESIDAGDRVDGTPRMRRLRQITPETGRFLALLAASAPEGTYVEIGTSAGYSTMWLALASQLLGRRLITFEILDEKIALARETFRLSGIAAAVELVHGDARAQLPTIKDIAFCFLDAEKEIYRHCYELIIPNMVRGGILVADNALNHWDTLQPMIERALADTRVDAMVVPVGKGELVCRKL